MQNQKSIFRTFKASEWLGKVIVALLLAKGVVQGPSRIYSDFVKDTMDQDVHCESGMVIFYSAWLRRTGGRPISFKAVSKDVDASRQFISDSGGHKRYGIFEAGEQCFYHQENQGRNKEALFVLVMEYNGVKDSKECKLTHILTNLQDVVPCADMETDSLQDILKPVDGVGNARQDTSFTRIKRQESYFAPILASKFHQFSNFSPSQFDEKVMEYILAQPLRAIYAQTGVSFLNQRGVDFHNKALPLNPFASKIRKQDVARRVSVDGLPGYFLGGLDLGGGAEDTGKELQGLSVLEDRKRKKKKKGTAGLHFEFYVEKPGSLKPGETHAVKIVSKYYYFGHTNPSELKDIMYQIELVRGPGSIEFQVKRNGGPAVNTLSISKPYTASTKFLYFSFTVGSGVLYHIDASKVMSRTYEILNVYEVGQTTQLRTQASYDEESSLKKLFLDPEVKEYHFRINRIQYLPPTESKTGLNEIGLRVYAVGSTRGAYPGYLIRQEPKSSDYPRCYFKSHRKELCFAMAHLKDSDELQTLKYVNQETTEATIDPERADLDTKPDEREQEQGLKQGCRVPLSYTHNKKCLSPMPGYLLDLSFLPKNTGLIKKSDFEALSKEEKMGYIVFENKDGSKFISSCPEICATCTPDFKCLTCKNGDHYLSLNRLSCGETCDDDKTFKDSASMRCMTCGTGCASCNKASGCSGCSTGFMLKGKECMECSEGCTDCQQSGCKACQTGMYLSDVSGDMTCLSCPDGCSKCKAGGLGGDPECTECEDSSFEVKDKKCVRKVIPKPPEENQKPSSSEEEQPKPGSSSKDPGTSSPPHQPETEPSSSSATSPAKTSSNEPTKPIEEPKKDPPTPKTSTKPPTGEEIKLVEKEFIETPSKARLVFDQNIDITNLSVDKIKLQIITKDPNPIKIDQKVEKISQPKGNQKTLNLAFNPKNEVSGAKLLITLTQPGLITAKNDKNLKFQKTQIEISPMTFYSPEPASKILITSAGLLSLAANTIALINLINSHTAIFDLIRTFQVVEFLALINTKLPSNLKVTLINLKLAIMDHMPNLTSGLKDDSCSIDKKKFEEEDISCYILDDQGDYFTLTAGIFAFFVISKLLVFGFKIEFLKKNVVQKMDLKFWVGYLEAIRLEIFISTFVSLNKLFQPREIPEGITAVLGLNFAISGALFISTMALIGYQVYTINRTFKGYQKRTEIVMQNRPSKLPGTSFSQSRNTAGRRRPGGRGSQDEESAVQTMLGNRSLSGSDDSSGGSGDSPFGSGLNLEGSGSMEVKERLEGLPRAPFCGFNEDCKTESLYSRFYCPLMAVKDLLISAFLVFFYHQAVVQAGGVSLILCTFFALDCFYRPLKEKKDQIESLIVGVIFTLLSGFLTILIAGGDSLDHKMSYYVIGYSSIGLVLALVLKNVVLSCISAYQGIMKIVKYFKGSGKKVNSVRPKSRQNRSGQIPPRAKHHSDGKRLQRFKDQHREQEDPEHRQKRRRRQSKKPKPQKNINKDLKFDQKRRKSHHKSKSHQKHRMSKDSDDGEEEKVYSPPEALRPYNFARGHQNIARKKERKEGKRKHRARGSMMNGGVPEMLNRKRRRERSSKKRGKRRQHNSGEF